MASHALAQPRNSTTSIIRRNEFEMTLTSLGQFPKYGKVL